VADGYRQLKKLSRTGGFQHAIFFDTETQSAPCDKYPRGELLTLKFGHAIYIKLHKGKIIQRESLDFTDHLSFWTWVLLHTQARQPLWLFAHNLPFDLTVTRVWELVSEGVFTLSAKPGKEEAKRHDIPLVVMDDPPTIIEFRTSAGDKIVSVDTLNYWRVSLAILGQKVGLSKQSIEFDAASQVQLEEYCRNDVEILVLAVTGLLGWVLENDYGAFRYSVPSLAFSVFRSRFYDGTIELHSNANVRQLERAAYYGGRLECYRIGHVNERVYEVDVCALYPFVMREHLYPVKLTEWSNVASPLDILSRKRASEMAAHVKIKSDHHEYPIRMEVGLCHPIGEYDTWLCGPELQHAYDNGCIEHIYSWARYEMQPLFAPFVNHFWQRRKDYEQAGDKLNADFCKLMMNSLYGKFGQLAPAWEYQGQNMTGACYGTIVEWDDVEKVKIKYRVIGDRIEKQNPDHHQNDGDNASPIIAAFVTAYGREWMRYLRGIAGYENVYYLVTDAILVNQAGMDRLSNSGLVQERVPGCLSMKAQADSLDMRAIHQWTLGEEIRRGGVKKKATEIGPNQYEEIHFEGLSAMLNLDSNITDTYDPLRPKGSRTSASYDPLPGVVIYPQVKQLSLEYRKGIVNKDGSVTPFTLPFLAASSS